MTHTCSPEDGHRLTGSLGVLGDDANCVCLILLQAIDHVRGGVALQRLLVDHPRSVGWGNKTEKCFGLLLFIHIMISYYPSFFSAKPKSVLCFKKTKNKYWLKISRLQLLTSGDEDTVRVHVAEWRCPGQAQREQPLLGHTEVCYWWYRNCKKASRTCWSR